MVQHKIIYFISLFILIASCSAQKDIYQKCKIATTNVTQEEYDVAINAWKDCLATQRLNEKTKAELYKDISGNSIEGEFLFLEDRMSDAYISYKALGKILTDEELKENLKLNDTGIKYHSFLAIAERAKEDVFEILKLFISDTTTVTSKLTCGPTQIFLVDLCIDVVTEKYFYNFPNYKPKHYQLTQAEKDQLDQLVLNSDLNLRYKEKLLKNK